VWVTWTDTPSVEGETNSRRRRLLEFEGRGIASRTVARPLAVGEAPVAGALGTGDTAWPPPLQAASKLDTSSAPSRLRLGGRPPI
jgi:hypothetical protein